jgi:hypothetical protein
MNEEAAVAVQERAEIVERAAQVEVALSRPGEFHPQPLREPDVNLSAHPAPITQTTREYTKLPVNEQVRMSTGILVEAALRPLPCVAKAS